MKRMIPILFCGLFFVSSTSFSQDIVRVVDPYKDQNISCAWKQHEGYGIFRICVDLNFDGQEDMILSRGWCGNASCEAPIYLKQSDGSYQKIEFELHPLSVNLKKIKTGEGQFSLYGHISAGEGNIAVYKVTSNSVNFMRVKTVHPNDSEQDRELIESLFGETTSLNKTEFGRCQNGELQWKNDLFR